MHGGCRDDRRIVLKTVVQEEWRNGCAGSLGSFVLSKNGQIDRRCSGWMGFGILRAGRVNVTDHPYSK